MPELTSMLEFVKDQADFHRSMIVKYDGNERRQRRHIETADLFDSLFGYLDNVGNSEPDTKEKLRLSLSWDEVEELPPELISELSVSDGDKTEFQILSAIEKLGGVASLDRIIVELWKAHNEVHKRAAVTNRLYRMAGKGLLVNVPGRKGIYSLKEMTAEEIEELR